MFWLKKKKKNKTNLTGVFDEGDLAVLLPYLLTPFPFFLQFHKVLN